MARAESTESKRDSKAETLPLVILHGGVSLPAHCRDGLERAADNALQRMLRAQHALLAALEAVATLEDDARFNCGTGANVRADNVSVEMDAAVMTSDRRFGAVASLRRVRHPVLVAAAVRENEPNQTLTGLEAKRFATERGFTAYDPSTFEARSRLFAARQSFSHDLHTGGGEWQLVDADRLWRMEGPHPGGTVGVVARDDRGRFAAAASTGGTLLMASGVVTEVALCGCAIFAGPHGAVSVTGESEEIVRRSLARGVYRLMESGLSAQEAANVALGESSSQLALGVIAIDKKDVGVATTRVLPVAMRY